MLNMFSWEMTWAKHKRCRHIYPHSWWLSNCLDWWYFQSKDNTTSWNHFWMFKGQGWGGGKWRWAWAGGRLAWHHWDGEEQGQIIQEHGDVGERGPDPCTNVIAQPLGNPEKGVSVNVQNLCSQVFSTLSFTGDSWEFVFNILRMGAVELFNSWRTVIRPRPETLKTQHWLLTT